MRKMLKRILVFALACNLFVMSVSSANIKAVTDVPRVQSSKVVVRNADLAAWLAGAGITISAETVLAWVLGILGFTAASTAVYENRDSLILWLDSIKQDFLQWCSESKEWCSVKAGMFERWLEMVASGSLDKASDCWGALKDYLTDLKSRIDDVNASAGSDTNIVHVDNAQEWLLGQCNSQSITSQTNTKVLRGDKLNQSMQQLYLTSMDWFYVSRFAKLVNIRINNSNNLIAINANWDTDMIDSFSSYCPGCYMSGFLDMDCTYYYGTYANMGDFCGTVGKTYFCNEMYNGPEYITYDLGDISLPSDFWSNTKKYFPILVVLSHGLVNGYDDWSIEIPKDDGVADDVAAGMTVAGGTAGVIERDGSLDNVDVVGVGGDVITGAKDDVVAVDVDGIDIQDLADPYPGTDTITIDKVGGVIVGTDTPIPDGVTDGQSKPRPKDDYTLPGLQDLFPFCIPFDLVMLYRTLTADAEAPCFTWEFVYYLDGKKKTKKIELDLSKFNKVAEIVRMMELLAFMIFLTIKTRDLIRG